MKYRTNPNPKIKFLGYRVTEQEYTRVQKEAAKKGLSASEYLELCVDFFGKLKK